MTADVIERITHNGTVVATNLKTGHVMVRIDEQAECSGCAAAKLCNKISDNNHTLKIYTKDIAKYKVGDKVTASGTEQMHRKAIMLATVFPCIILIATMTSIYLLTSNEALAVIVGICSTIIFFILLYLFRNKISHEFIFTLRHIDN